MVILAQDKSGSFSKVNIPEKGYFISIVELEIKLRYITRQTLYSPIT